MRLAKERMEESHDLISKYLVKCHRDKDENSLFCRFGEIMQEVESLQWDVSSWTRVSNALSKIECSKCRKYLQANQEVEDGSDY